MGRHVLSVPRHFEDSTSLFRATQAERKLSFFYLVGMVLFTIGCLSYTPLVPYVLEHRWHFFISASVCFLFLNVRDLLVIVNQALPPDQPGESDELEYRKPASIFSADTFSASLLLAGSLMLCNAGVLSKINGDDDLTSKWQLIGSFAAYLIGYGVNTMNFHPDAIDVIETRNAVVFQMSMSTTLNLIGALVDTIGSSENEALHLTLKAWLHGIAGVIALGAAFVNHFHTMAFMSNEEILLAERRYKVVQARKASKADQSGVRQKLWNAIRQSAIYLKLLKMNEDKYNPVPNGSDIDLDPELVVDGTEDSSAREEREIVGSGTISDSSSLDDSMIGSSSGSSKQSLGQTSQSSLLGSTSEWPDTDNDAHNETYMREEIILEKHSTSPRRDQGRNKREASMKRSDLAAQYSDQEPEDLSSRHRRSHAR